MANTGNEVDVWLVNNGDYWRAAWRDGDGRTRGKSLGAKAKLTRREARVLCRRLSAELSRPAAPAKPSAPRLSEWWGRYTAQRDDVAEKTLRTYRLAGVYLAVHFAADPPIDRITRADAAAWRAALSSGELTARLNQLAAADPGRYRNPSSGRPWQRPTAATVALQCRVAKLFFRAAADQDLIPFNPFDRVKGTAPRVRKDWRQVSRAELAAVLDACPSPPWRALFALARLAGLRLGECHRLRWQDVDWAGNKLRVNATARTDTTKVRPRVCPIVPPLLPTDLGRVLRDAFDAAAPGSAGPCDGVPTNNFYKMALGILTRAGVGAYAKPFHTLRKNWEGELAGAYPQHVVCDWLGHGITVSAEHYLRVPAELFQPAGAVWTQDWTQPTTGGQPDGNPTATRNGAETEGSAPQPRRGR